MPDTDTDTEIPATPSTTEAIPNGFDDDDDDVVFDQSTVNRPSGSSSATESESTGFVPIELPKPCGIRTAYVAGMKVVTPPNGGVMSLVVQIQVADADFPAGDDNKPIDLRIKQTETTKLKAVLAVLGMTMADLGTKAGLAKGIGIHCRAFVTVYQDRLQIASFLPSWSKQGDDNASFFDHIRKLGVDTDSDYYTRFRDAIVSGVKYKFCGLLPAE